MRRRIAALLAAGMLASVLAGSASAAPVKVTRPSLETTACTSSTGGGLTLTHTWVGQNPTSNALTVSVTFKASNMSESQSANFLYGATLDSDSFVVWWPNPYIGAPWNTYTSIASSVTGAFSATAKTIRQPRGGWPAC